MFGSTSISHPDRIYETEGLVEIADALEIGSVELMVCWHDDSPSRVVIGSMVFIPAAKSLTDLRRIPVPRVDSSLEISSKPARKATRQSGW